MYDPVIKELFPEQESLYYKETFDSSENGSGDYDGKLFSYPDNPDSGIKTVINCLSGKYNLSYTLSHYGESCFPSSNARHNFLHLQLLCSATFSGSHYTQRKGLSSFLIAQTFYGSGVLKYEGKEYVLEEDDVFFIDCQKEHEYYAITESGWGYRFAHFDGSMVPGYYQQVLSSSNIKYQFGKESNFLDAFKKLYKMCRKEGTDKEIYINLILTEMLTEILCQLPKYQTMEIPDTIEMQCSYLQEHCCEKLYLEKLSKKFGLSKFHMSREFKRYTGKTIYEYITDCRIAVAQRLLRYSDMLVSDIAVYVGYEDHNGFYRTFLQKEEISPSAYRKKWKSL